MITAIIWFFETGGGMGEGREDTKESENPRYITCHPMSSQADASSSNPLFLGRPSERARRVVSCPRHMQDDGGRFPITIIVILVPTAAALLFPAPPKINLAVKVVVAPEGKRGIRCSWKRNSACQVARKPPQKLLSRAPTLY